MMPYIPKEKRIKINKVVSLLADLVEDNGEVNYAITRALHVMIMGKILNYALLNSAIGVLECVKLELYRMVVAKYEDKKRMENGPISDLDAKSLEEVR